jgi:hypothetical protein
MYLYHSVVLFVEFVELFDVLIEVLKLLMRRSDDRTLWDVHLNILD